MHGTKVVEREMEETLPEKEHRIAFDCAEFYMALYSMKHRLEGADKGMPSGVGRVLAQFDDDKFRKGL